MTPEVLIAALGVLGSIVGIVGGLVATLSSARLKAVEGRYETRLKELENEKQEATAQAQLELKLTGLIDKSIEYQRDTARASRQTARQIGQMVTATRDMTDAINNMRTRMEDWDDRTRQSMEMILKAFEVIEAGITVSYSLQEETADSLKPIIEIIDELRSIPKRTEDAVNRILLRLEELVVNRLVHEPDNGKEHV